jgi:hypothetical protein
MIEKKIEKEEAIKLRKKGFSYNEILKKIPVTKSTLSVWLRDIGLARRQKQRLTKKRKLAQIKACEACRSKRVQREKEIIRLAKKQIKEIPKIDSFIIGSVLYWAEGTKQKKGNVSQRVTFSNSDPNMILLFNRWLIDICKIPIERLLYSIYIHRTADKERAIKYWGKLLKTKIKKIYFKNHNPKNNRKNIDVNYNGLLRIDVRRSTDLNRKIYGWILGIIEKSKI